MDAPPEANFLTMVGKLAVLERIVGAWQQLMDADPLRDTPPPKIIPLPEGIKMLPDPIRVARIGHTAGMGAALLQQIIRECQDQLGLVHDKDFFVEGGYHFTPV